MKKKFIIIGLITLITIISIILIFKHNKKVTIEPINATNIENIEEQPQKIEEECGPLNYPLLSKRSDDEYPIIDSNGPITEEKLKSIIDYQLSFLIYKNNYQEITNEDLFYEALAVEKITDTSVSKEKLESALEKTVLGNLKLKHESHNNKYIYLNGIYTLNDKYRLEDIYDEHPIYGEVQALEEKNGIYTISIKYLWITRNNESALYKNRYDAIKRINKIQIPDNVKCNSKWMEENFKKYEKKLPTYTYSFKEVNNHIYLVDYDTIDNK